MEGGLAPGVTREYLVLGFTMNWVLISLSLPHWEAVSVCAGLAWFEGGVMGESCETVFPTLLNASVQFLFSIWVL